MDRPSSFNVGIADNQGRGKLLGFSIRHCVLCDVVKSAHPYGRPQLRHLASENHVRLCCNR